MDEEENKLFAMDFNKFKDQFLMLTIELKEDAAGIKLFSYFEKEKLYKYGELLFYENGEFKRDVNDVNVAEWHDTLEIVAKEKRGVTVSGAISTYLTNKLEQLEEKIGIKDLKAADGKYYIECPYKEKLKAKELGAMWDRAERKWYFENLEDAPKFERWITSKPLKESEIIEKNNIINKVRTRVKEIFDVDKYKRYLTTMANMPSYSYRNILLISLQNPNATLITTFHNFEAMYGYKVNKGEKAIEVLKPNKYNKSVDATIKEIDRYINDNGKSRIGQYVFEKTVSGQYQIHAGFGNTRIFIEEIDKKQLRKFLSAKVIGKAFSFPPFIPYKVFDISQTRPIMIKGKEGEEYPDPKNKNLDIDLISKIDESNIDDVKILYEAISRISELPITYNESEFGEKAFYKTDMTINITPTNEPIQALKTLVYEVVQNRLYTRQRTKEQRKIEVESITYVICQHFGMDTLSYTFGDLENWSGDKGLETLENCLATIQKESNGIINAIDIQLKQLREQDLMSVAEHLNNPVFERNSQLENGNQDMDLPNQELTQEDNKDGSGNKMSLSGHTSEEVYEVLMYHLTEILEESDIELKSIKLYGSRVEGTYTDKSDLNVAVSYLSEKSKEEVQFKLDEELFMIGALNVTFKAVNEKEMGLDDFILESKKYREITRVTNTKLDNNTTEESFDKEPQMEDLGAYDNMELVNQEAKQGIDTDQSDKDECEKSEQNLIEIQYFVAECLEDTSIGRLEENISSFNEAQIIYDSFPDNENGKGIGIYITHENERIEVKYPYEDYANIVLPYLTNKNVYAAIEELNQFYSTQIPERYWNKKKIKFDKESKRAGSNICVKLYQLKIEKTREYGFESYNVLANLRKKEINKNNYNLILRTNLTKVPDMKKLLDVIYEIGNTTNDLQKFVLPNQELRNISVSDIICIGENNKDIYYYVDNYGFKELADFKNIEPLESNSLVNKFLKTYQIDPVVAITENDYSIDKRSAQILAGIHGEVLRLPKTDEELKEYIKDGKARAEKISKASKYVTVMIRYSESNQIKSGEILSLKDANKKMAAVERAIKEIKEENKEECVLYEKIELSLFFKDTEKDQVYVWDMRINIGDGYQKDLLSFLKRQVIATNEGLYEQSEMNSNNQYLIKCKTKIESIKRCTDILNKEINEKDVAEKIKEDGYMRKKLKDKVI